MQPGFTPPQNIIGTKQSYQQFSTGFQPLTTSSFATLGSNSYSSAFNVPYFNSKLPVTDSLNNNYMYPHSLYNGSSKLPPYTNSQSSTQIYPPYGNSNMFPGSVVNSSLLGSSSQQPANSNSNFTASSMLHVGNSTSVASTDTIPATPVGLNPPSKSFTSHYLHSQGMHFIQ